MGQYSLSLVFDVAVMMFISARLCLTWSSGLSCAASHSQLALSSLASSAGSFSVSSSPPSKSGIIPSGM